MSEISFGDQQTDPRPAKSVAEVGSFGQAVFGSGAVLAVALGVSDMLAAVAALTVEHALSAALWPDGGLLGAIPATHSMFAWAAVMVLVFAYGGLYGRSTGEAVEIRRAVSASLVVAAISFVVQATQQYGAAVATVDWVGSALWTMTAWLSAGFLAIAFRQLIRSAPAARTALTDNFVLVGSGVERDVIERQLTQSAKNPVRVLRALPVEAFAQADAEILKTRISMIAAGSGVDERRVKFLLAPGDAELPGSLALEQVLTSIGQPFAVTLPHEPLARRGAVLRAHLGSDVLLADMEHRKAGALERMVKSVFDFVGALVLVVILAPLLLVLSALLMLEPGGVFFAQTRVGRNGRRFRCLKFRTMLPDAQERLQHILATDPAAAAEWAKHQKLTNDPRVTAVGRFLRATSLDELPQLFNVLLGDMSLVGPRPIIAPEIDGYAGDRAYYHSDDFRYYAAMTPGITGLWQVSGRTGTTHCERVRLDRWYACNWSLWLDLAILFRTIRAVFARTGC